MKMTKEQHALRNLIATALHYKDEGDSTIEFYWDSLTRPDLSEQGLQWAFQELCKNGIIKAHNIGYKDSEHATAMGSMSARVSTPTRTHTRMHYVAQVDRDKFAALDYKKTESKSEFVDTTAQLIVDDETFQLPPHKNEHWLCRGAFEYAVNEPISWDVLYEQMTDHLPQKPEDTKRNWRRVYDAMEAVNKRIIEKGLEPLFIWTEKMLKRNR